MRISNHTIVLYVIYIIVVYYLFSDAFMDWLNTKGKGRNKVYVFYQALHFTLIYFIGEMLITKDLISDNLVPSEVLRWCLFIIIILKPINLSFKILFQRYAPEESDSKENAVEGAGAIIGILERLLIVILICYDQFGGIGLVFTAKSVARFDKISKDPVFAEYYLIGSLYSIISVLLCYGVIIN